MTSPGYIELLRRKPAFRRLWLTSFVLYIGDWFSVIAMFVLAGDASGGSPLAIAGVLAARSFTFAPCEPLVGAAADRWSRRSLMVIANAFSFVVLVSFLYLELLDDLFFVYLLASLLVVGRALHDPASTAYVQNICDRDEIVTANTMVSAAWSASMGFGAALGGWIIAIYGFETGLLIDSMTFLFASMVFYTLPHGGPDHDERKNANPREIVVEIVEGWVHVFQRPHLRRIILAKISWAVSGGCQIFILVLIGNEAGFGAFETGAAGIGILYMARGFGSGFGPVTARPLVAKRSLMPYVIGFSLCGAGMGYVTLSYLEWGLATICLVFISHSFSGISWVASSSFLMQRASKSFMGRIASLDSLGITLTMGISTLAGGYILEEGWVTIREALTLSGLIQVAAGLAWLLIASPREREYIQSENIGQPQ